MRNLCAILLPLFFCAACASPAYVLHTRAPTKPSNFISPPKENAPIANTDGIALLYPRDRLVVFERKLDDGSVWVNYSVVLKNSTDKAVEFEPADIRLEVDGKRVEAVFEKSDRKPGFNAVGPKTYFSITTRFHVPAELVDQYGDSSEPLDLVIPVRKVAELRQKVWLWKE